MKLLPLIIMLIICINLFSQKRKISFVPIKNTCGIYMIYGVPNKFEVIMEGVYCSDYSVECKNCTAKKDSACIIEITPTDSTISYVNYTLRYKNETYEYSDAVRIAEAPKHVFVSDWWREWSSYKLDRLETADGEDCILFSFKILSFEFEFVKNGVAFYKNRHIGNEFSDEDRNPELRKWHYIHVFNIHLLGSDGIQRIIENDTLR